MRCAMWVATAEGRGATVRGARTAAVRAAAILAALALTIAAPAAAQRGQGQAAAADGVEPPAGSPAEIQRMFDSYALIQAQDQLKISDEKFPQFLGRFKALQDVRRRNMTERFRLIQELRRLTNDTPPDEARMRERLKALDDLDGRSQAELSKAYESINKVPDVYQQGNFRFFKKNRETPKLAWVMRPRQANRRKP